MTIAQGILEDLSHLNALLDAQLQVFRRNLTDPYRGLYVSDEDVDAALSVAPRLDAPAEYVRVLESVRARWQEPSDPASPLDELLHAAGLGPTERGVLLLCLAPEIDLRYQRIYAYLHDDIAKKAPTVELAINLLSTSQEERAQCRGVLVPEAPLRAWGLVDVLAPEPAERAPFLTHSLHLTERTTQFLLQEDSAPLLPAFAELIEPGACPPYWAELEANACRRVEGVADPVAVHLVGEALARRGVACALAERLGVRLLLVACRAMVDQGADPGACLRRLRCESLLSRALVCWDGLEAVLGANQQWRHAITSDLGTTAGLQLAGASTVMPGMFPSTKEPLVVEIPPPTLAEQGEAWRRALAGRVLAEPIDFTGLAARHPLEPGRIEQASRLAIARAQGRPIRLADLERACRSCSAPDFGELAQRVDTRYAWEDLVLPADRLAVLHEICTHARLRLLVDERWGFARHGAAARGLSVLLSGPSGTGKTMSAGVVARALGLELYRIDLSRVVSKYIGETEKNLARVFDVARGSAVCLLFDEADALFAKRSEVKDAHDRFANIETSYLLQRLEDHDGPVFLSTNLRHNMDSAFLRRLTFLLHFNPPDEAQRRELWRRIWPAETPLESDLDCDFLARAFNLTGGHIRNVAVAAAVRALGEQRAVGMADVVHAIRREYEKLGKSVAGEEFRV